MQNWSRLVQPYLYSMESTVVVDLKNQFNVGTAAAVAAVTNRKEQQEAEVAEARIAKAEADDLLACASQPVGMYLDLDFASDEVFQNADPTHEGKRGCAMARGPARYGGQAGRSHRLQVAGLLL